MPSYINTLLFTVYPYVALAIMIIGSILRYDREPYSWRSGSSQLLRRKQLVWGSVLFHVGILTVFFGHLIGLFTPVWVLDAIGIPYALKQWMAVIIGGPAGIAALIGSTMLLHRRLVDLRIRVTSTIPDILIMVLIFSWLLLTTIVEEIGKFARNRQNVDLKRELLDRGLEADEIKTILEAKPSESDYEA